MVVYTVSLIISNDDGVLYTRTYRYVVVYDPLGGFVTGGGWFESPAGAVRSVPTATGKATFGFISKYKKDADVPIGNTEFVFQTVDLKFRSTDYDWLVVTGSNYARFKGTGTINGQGGFKFLIWAGDGTGEEGADTFRIKIWVEYEDDTEYVVYDNGENQIISGGSIVVHKK